MTGNSFFTFWNRAWITVWLVLVYVVSLWLVLGALSSYQLQSRISADNEQNQSGNTVSAVIRQLRAIENFDYQIEFAQSEIKSTKLALQKTLISARNLEIEVDELNSELERLWLRFVQTGDNQLNTRHSLEENCTQLMGVLKSGNPDSTENADIFETVNHACDSATKIRRDLKYKKAGDSHQKTGTASDGVRPARSRK